MNILNSTLDLNRAKTALLQVNKTSRQEGAKHIQSASDNAPKSLLSAATTVAETKKNEHLKTVNADFNNDGVVNFADLNMMLNATNAKFDSRYDLNQDGAIDKKDVSVVSALYGSAGSMTINMDRNGDGRVDFNDLNALLSEANGPTDPEYSHEIALFQALFA